MRRSNGMRAATAFTAIAAVAVATAALGTAAPASAELTAELQDLSLPAVAYSHQERTVSGRVVLTAADTAPADESEGWQVSQQASDLRYSGLHHGTDIPAGNLAVTSVESPAAADGLSEEVDPVGGPRVPTVPPVGSLNAPRIVLEARPGHGGGTYTQGIVLSLTLPSGTRTGTYTGTITTTISPSLGAMVDAAAEPTASPEPTPTASPEPTADTEPEPTASPEPAPTVTPEPSAAPEPEAASAPTASPEPEPTVSTGPEPTPSPAPEPTASTDPTP